MLRHYGILNGCLEILKNSSLPAVIKLKLEVQLIQIKRILLNDQVKHPVSWVASCEQVFTDLQESIQTVCNSAETDGEAESLLLLCLKIKNDLESELKHDDRDYPGRGEGVIGMLVSNFKGRF